MPEPFAPAYEFDVTFGGVVIGLNSFTYNESHATWDTTVHTDRGATSVGIAEYTCTLRFTAPVKVADEANYPDSGDRVAVVFTSGGKTRSGSAVITSMEETLGGRGGKNRNYQATFSGQVTNVTAGASS